MKKNVIALLSSAGLGILFQFIFVVSICPFGCPEDTASSLAVVQPVSYLVSGIIAFIISRNWIVSVLVIILMVIIGYLFFGSLPIPV